MNILLQAAWRPYRSLGLFGGSFGTAWDSLGLLGTPWGSFWLFGPPWCSLKFLIDSWCSCCSSLLHAAPCHSMWLLAAPCSNLQLLLASFSSFQLYNWGHTKEGLFKLDNFQLYNWGLSSLISWWCIWNSAERDGTVTLLNRKCCIWLSLITVRPTSVHTPFVWDIQLSTGP